MLYPGCVFPILFNFDCYDFVGVGRVLSGDIFVLEFPVLIKALYGHAKGIMSVFAVDGIDSLGQCGLSVTVNGIKDTSLYGIVPMDVTDDDSCILIMVDAVALPL